MNDTIFDGHDGVLTPRELAGCRAALAIELASDFSAETPEATVARAAAYFDFLGGDGGDEPGGDLREFALKFAAKYAESNGRTADDVVARAKAYVDFFVEKLPPEDGA